MSLMMSEISWLLEISQVFMVSDDSYWVLSFGKVVTPFL